MNKKNFTQEEYKNANRISILEVAQKLGYRLKSIGSNRYTIVGMDSMRIDESKNAFTRFSNHASGGVIQFVMEMEGKNIVEAVNFLNGNDYGIYRSDDQEPKVQDKAKTTKEEVKIATQSKEFTLPKRAKNLNRLFAYLTLQRGIEPEIIREMLHRKSIYQSDFSYRGQNHSTCVFVGMDENKNPVSASLRLIGQSQTSNWRIAKHSNTAHSFCMEGRNQTLQIYESAIDAMSGASIDCLLDIDWKEDHRIALNGLSMKPIETYLAKHPQIEKLCFCLDNDDAQNRSDSINRGQERAKELLEHFSAQNYSVESRIPKEKDFNDALINFRKILEAQEQRIQEDESWDEEMEM